MSEARAGDEQTRAGKAGRVLRYLAKPHCAVIGIVGFVVWAHLGSGIPSFQAHGLPSSGWQQFRDAYAVNDFGGDGHFVRAVQNGYNLFYSTHQYAWRFTRKTAGDAVKACANCHTPDDMAYSFVNSDRFDSRLGKRLSFEERIMRCYANHMDGFVPTLYDPAVRDLRILARAVAHRLQLNEGAPKAGG